MIISVLSKPNNGQIDHLKAYKGLISALKHFLVQRNDKNCTIMTDSKIIVKQLNHGWKVNDLLLPQKKIVETLLEQALFEGRKVHIQYAATSKLKPKGF